MVLKKALKILLGLTIVNLIVSAVIAFIYGESRILSFIPIGAGSYEVRGIFASTFLLAIMLIIYFILYAILPVIIGGIRNSFNITKKFTDSIAGIFGEKAKEDVEYDFSLYIQKMISSIVILCAIIIIPVDYLIISETQNGIVIGAFFLLAILFLFFLRKIYALLD
jgi:hypothetical protein